MNKNHLFNVLRAIFAFTFLAFIIMYIGPAKLVGALLSANPFFVFLAILLALLLLTMNAFAINLLLKHMLVISFSDFFKKYIISWAFGTMLPGRLGDFSLGFLLRDKIPASKTFAVVLIDKLLTLLLYSSVTLIWIFYLFANNAILQLVPAVVLLWLALMAVLFSKQMKQFILGVVKKYFENHNLAISYFSETFFFLLNKKRTAILGNFLASVLRMLTIAAIFYLLLLSFGVQPNYPALVIIVAMVAIMAFIPVSINGLGLREASFIFLCAQIDIPAVISASAVLISTSVDYIVTGLVFICQVFPKKK